MRKWCESVYKMQRLKCESNIKINGRDTPTAVCSSAYLRVTLAYVVRPNLHQKSTSWMVVRVNLPKRYIWCAEGLWRMRGHGPVIAQCTNLVVFP